MQGDRVAEAVLSEHRKAARIERTHISASQQHRWCAPSRCQTSKANKRRKLVTHAEAEQVLSLLQGPDGVAQVATDFSCCAGQDSVF